MLMQPYVVRVLILIAASSPALLCARVRAESHSTLPDESGEELQPAEAATEEAPAPRKTSSGKRPSQKKTAAAKANKRRERQPTLEYQRMRDGWHAAIEAEPVATPDDVRRPLVIDPI